MKRVSAALAALFAVVLVGTASAQVPDGATTAAKLRQWGIMSPRGVVPAPGQAAEPVISDVAESGSEALDPETVEAVNSAIEDGAPLADDVLAGLPAEVADILTSLPFMPAPAETVVAAPAASLVPEIGPAPAPAESPKPAPAPKPKVKQRAAAKLRAAIGDRDGVFPNLPAGEHAGTTNGSVIHVDALTAGTQLGNVDVAFSGSTFTSSPIAKTLTNEMARVTSQALGANSGFGRGSGLEVGLAQPEGADGQVILAQRAEAKAPPTTPLISNEVGPVDLQAAVASLLRGQAQARATAACTTGIDLSYGQGYAADAGVIPEGTGHLVETTPASPTEGAVSQSTSRTRLVAQEGGPANKFGLMSETRQIIAPVNIGPLTIEFLGEWVLRAVADGKGVGEVFYGPGTAEPATPILRVLNGTELLEEVLLQDLLGPTGLTVGLPGVVEIAIGEDPRAIGGDVDSKPVESVTYAAGAVDVARVTLLNGAGADIRIGHMEAAVAVPAGGIDCAMGMTKVAQPERLLAGESFIWKIAVTNLEDCVLTKVKVVDTISTPGTTAIKWTVDGTEPKAESQSNTSITWNDIGPINPLQTKELVIRVTVDKTSGGGKFLDEAVATGVCGHADASAGASAGAGTGAPLEARASVNLPEVTAVLAEAPLRGELPRTGGLFAALPAFALLGSGLALRRLRGRR